MKRLYALVICIACTFSALAVTRTAVGNAGNGWSNASNWSPAGVPQAGDTVIIPSGFTLSVKGTVYSSPLPLLIVEINGTLNFQPSGRLQLAAGSMVNIYSPGLINSTNSSSEILSINGITKFSGQTDGSISIPSYASNATGTSPNGFVPFVLPVKLVSFTAEKKESSVLLKWITAAEINSDKFQIEKSTDGNNWAIISTTAAAGNYSGLSTYSASDIFPSSGANLYRLKSVDRDGKYEYSRILNVYFLDKPGKIIVSPNPATTTLSIFLHNNSGSIADLQLVNQTGQQVKHLAVAAGTSALTLDIADLAKGLYVLVVTEAGSKKYSLPVIIR